MSKYPNPYKFVEELCNGGIPKNQMGVIMAQSDEPKTHIKTIQVSKELINDLIPIVDDRIRFITMNLHHNRGPLGDELQRLKEFSKIIDKLSCEK
jgi:hypothetical protein